MFGYIWNLIATKKVWNGTTILSLIAMYLPKLEDSMALNFFLRSARVSFDLFMETLGLVYLPQRKRLPPVTNPLLLQSATELVKKIKSGELRSETLVRAYIFRIKEVNGHINALVGDRFESAIEEAKALDDRIARALRNPSSDNVLELPLLGIPFTIKESIAVEGQPCTAGLYSRKDLRMDTDAPIVKKLRDAGAIILGVTNIPEFLLWWDTNNRLYGRTNNPYDLSRISGGSSGGEGALISAGGSLVGLGSDIGGSIRIPSFFCGIFGHKPSSNLITADGHFPYCGHPEREKYMVIGPMCRYAVDMKLIFKQIVNDQTILKLDEPVDLRQTKFYFLTSDNDPFKTSPSNDVINGIKSVRNFLTEEGYTCIDIQLPLLRKSFFMWLTSIADVDSPKLGAEVVERNGELNGWLELVKSFTVGSKFRKITCMNVILENMVHRKDTRDWKVFRDLIDNCQNLKRQLESILDDNSILVLPTLPEKPPKHNGTFLRMNNCGYTAIFNIMECPVTHCTIGLGKDSQMPVGFQMVAKRLNDRFTLAAAELLSDKFGGWTPPFETRLC